MGGNFLLKCHGDIRSVVENNAVATRKRLLSRGERGSGRTMHAHFAIATNFHVNDAEERHRLKI
jgi:hypothetical protein